MKILLITCVIATPLFTHSSVKKKHGEYPVAEKIIFYQLGNKSLQLKISQYGERKDIVFINLHDDEFTSVEAAKMVLVKKGGLLIKIENDRQRNIRFRLRQSWYQFDPNCMFTYGGIKTYLSKNSRFSKASAAEIERLGKRVLQLIPEETSFIISLHNNTDGHFSALSYNDGNEKSGDASRLSLKSGKDPDDFFFTTDDKLFELLSAENYNVILQDNKNCRDDGSLSVYCGKNNIRYVNIETEHGKTDEYFQMCSDLIQILNSEKIKK